MYDPTPSSPSQSPSSSSSLSIALDIKLMPTLYLAPLVHSISLDTLEFLPRALVCVASNGTIAWVEREVPNIVSANAYARLRGIDIADTGLIELDEGFLCPGLIDTHTHAPQYPNNGLGQQFQLLEWLETLTFPQEARCADVTYARQLYDLVVRRNLAAGTTTCCYYGTLHSEGTAVLADVCFEKGQRALIGKCNMDRLCPPTYIEPSAEASLAATHTFLNHFSRYGNDDLVRPIITPRFALSCTPELLTALGQLATERDLPVQTHLSENVAEVKRAKELFPDCDTYAGVYERFGLLGPKTILAHCVHLDDAEREVIARTGAGVSHCPSSNLNLNSGAARVSEMFDKGIKVGLGTDCSGGCQLGILSAVRNASTVSRTLAFSDLAPRALSISELFHMATLGGAELCGLEKEIGNFIPGKQFDALWVRPRSPGMFVEPGESVNRVLEKWLFTGDDRDIASVWVRGRQVAGNLAK